MIIDHWINKPLIMNTKTCTAKINRVLNKVGTRFVINNKNDIYTGLKINLEKKTQNWCVFNDSRTWRSLYHCHLFSQLNNCLIRVEIRHREQFNMWSKRFLLYFTRRLDSPYQTNYNKNKENCTWRKWVRPTTLRFEIWWIVFRNGTDK